MTGPSRARMPRPFSRDAKRSAAPGAPPSDRPGAVWGPPPAYQPPPADARAALAAVYARLAAALGPAADACRACGRCCRFEPGGLVLFASALEMAHLVADAGLPDAGRLVVGSVFERAWTCPYQSGDRCGARDGRTLGCRTHFCDADAGPQGRALYDAALAEIRAVADAHAYPWWYGPAKVYLDAVGAAPRGRPNTRP